MKTFELLKTFILLLSLGVLINLSASAQNGVSINATGTPADSSAILDVSSHSKGFLIPRLNQAERNAIVNPAEGLQIFNTTTKCLEIYVLNMWQSIFCGCIGAPATPGTITGSTNVCSGQNGISYSITPVNGATTYTWSVPPGTVITSGQGTMNITVAYGNASGNITVFAGNSCGTSSASILAITVSSPPATPGTISGPATVNINQSGVVYSIMPVTGATSYNWTVPVNAVITAGQGSTSITVTFDSTSGNVCVEASNSCGTSSNCLAVNVTTCPPGSQTFNYTGAIQTFTVPLCVTSLSIEAWGAQGGSVTVTCAATGGKGARMKGTFTVTGGEVFSILVGQQGPTNGSDAGGGGGTFIVRTGNVPLIIAGGGGGATNNITSCGSNRNGIDASITTSGTASADGVVAGGTGGNGGGANVGSGGGGGGFSTNGTGGSGTPASGGKAYVNGGAGGTGLNVDGGGYGGGGAGWFTGGNGGGGGGYSGGGTNGNQPYSGGGGGGSYNSGTSQSNSAGVQTGNGMVVITW